MPFTPVDGLPSNYFRTAYIMGRVVTITPREKGKVERKMQTLPAMPVYDSQMLRADSGWQR
jgi:hypothetical protein